MLPVVSLERMAAQGEVKMDLHEAELQTLIAKGKAQGYLTYDEINAYLPDEDVNPEKLDNLLVALEEAGIELLEQAPADRFDDEAAKGPTTEELQAVATQEEVPLLTSAEIGRAHV